MKKLLTLILSLTMATATLTSCGLFDIADESSGSTNASSVETPEEKTYTVTFKQMGEADVEVEVKEGGSLVGEAIPATKEKVGYTVTWKEADLAKLTNITADLVVEAKLEAKTYTVTYDAKGGTCPSTQKVVYDSEVILAKPELADNQFVGWFNAEGQKVSDGKWTIASDVTLTAEWLPIGTGEEEEFTVVFVQDGQEIKKETVKAGESITAIPTPTEKLGYTMDANWYTDETYTTVASLENIQSNMSVYAKATANTYKVTIKDDMGELEGVTKDVTYDAAYDLTPTSAPTGYSFGGFTKDGAAFAEKDTAWKLTENVELKVVWTAKKYTVKLDANEGTCDKVSVDVVYGEAYELPTPTKKNYIFEGWYQGDTKVELTGTWSLTGASIELVAHWRAEEWTKNY